MRGYLAGMAAAAALAVVAVGGDASAANRAWVSGHGVDQAGCGAPTAPCRSLQYAHDHAVDAGGEIDILDPAGYGSIVITKAISIVNDGVGTAGVQTTSSKAIFIDVGVTGAVYLRGLNIDGVQESGSYGVWLASAGSLSISNCVIRHFGGPAIILKSASGAVALLVADTLLADNGGAGLIFRPDSGTANMAGTIERVISTHNAEGVELNGQSSGGTGGFTIADSQLNDNSGDGLFVLGNGAADGMVVNVDNTHMDRNADGLAVTTGSIAYLSRSVADQNRGFGVDVSTVGISAATAFSTHDNRIEGNASGAVSGTLTTDALR